MLPRKGRPLKSSTPRKRAPETRHGLRDSGLNFTETLLVHASERPDHPAIEEDGRCIATYAVLPARVDAAAASLVAAGLQPGDYTGLMVRNSADLLIAALAIFRAGGVLICLSPDVQIGENHRLAEQLEIKFMVTDDGAVEGFKARQVSLATVCDTAAPPGVALPKVGGEAEAVCLPSSGTTGMPKAVTWSHARVIEWGERLIKYSGWSPQDRYLITLLMTFGYGRALATGLLQAGGTVVIQNDVTIPRLSDVVGRRAITLLYMTPTHLRVLLQQPHFGKPLLPNVRALYSASAPITTAERQQARTRLTPNLYETYGTNEAGPLTIATPADLDRHPDSVGRVIEEVEIEVVDQSGRPLPPNRIGLVRFRAANFPTRYVRNPEASARHFRDGWFYPGDVAALDQDRYLFFKGRADDVINNQGVKFYPIEIEDVLLSHPKVVEAAVIGVTHPLHGEVPIGFVVAQDGIDLDALKVYCGQELASFKVPRRIHRCYKLPKNELGKVLKRALKADRERWLLRKNLKV